MQRILGIDPGLVSTGYAVSESAAGDKLLRLLDALEDLDDVQNVYCNANLPAGQA